MSNLQEKDGCGGTFPDVKAYGMRRGNGEEVGESRWEYGGSASTIIGVWVWSRSSCARLLDIRIQKLGCHLTPINAVQLVGWLGDREVLTSARLHNHMEPLHRPRRSQEPEDYEDTTH